MQGLLDELRDIFFIRDNPGYPEIRNNQDMSIAGKRAGLDGERSGLFHEAIRIVKEMREKTNGDKPRYICWENVPGAFSSNDGADFKAVLEAVIGVKEPTCEVPAPGKNGWPYADVYLGDGWSVAYRLLDAQLCEASHN